MPLRYVVVLLVCLLPTPVRGQRQNQLNQQIQTILIEQKLVGAVWTTVVSTGRIVVDCAGFSNKPAGQKLRPTDRIHVGSITKTVLALGVLRLVTEGKVGLSDPLTNYLPDLPIQNPWATKHPIRVEHLLDHTAGLEDVRLWHIFSAGTTPNTPLAEVFRRDPSVFRVRTRPGYYLPVVSKYEPLALIDLYANVRQVRIEGNEVVIDPMQKPAFRLTNVRGNKFRIEGRQLPSMAFSRNEYGQMVISDGLTPLRKVSGVAVLGVWLSLGLGALGLVWLLLSGLSQWFRCAGLFRRRPIVWATGAGLLLLVPMPFLVRGDLTVGSGLLALATGLLPVGLVVAGNIGGQVLHWPAPNSMVSLFC